MDFNMQLQNYIQSRSERFSARSLERYKYLLGIYRDFLYKCNHGTEDNLSAYLDELTPPDIFESLEFYIKHSTAKSEDTARFYVSAVKDFVQFLNGEKIIHSEKLINSFGLKSDSRESFSYLLNACIEDLHKKNLITSTTKDALPSESEIETAINCCNEYISISEMERVPKKSDGYNRFVKSLIIKLILLTGARFTPRIKSIKRKDLNLDDGILNIGAFQIHLPDMLREQFVEYSKIWYCKEKNDPLFRFYNNKPVDQPNQLISVIVHKTDISSTISLAKYAILGMLDIGIDGETIMEFTGYKDGVYGPCKAISELEKLDNKIQFLDKKIEALPLFKRL